jgi:tetratricopeptide (TPR) repeat protein
MSKLQIIVVAIASILFLGLYFGGDIKPETQKAVEKTRTLSATSTSIASILSAAKSNLPVDTLAIISSIEKELSASNTDSTKIEYLKKLAGTWYDVGRADISGHYAEQVANILNNEESWSIAGTTYMIGARKASEDKIKDFCFSNASKAFENAISINPTNYANKVNLALCFTENPPQDNPMKGILMLREYNQQAPENVLVLTTLARLAIQTNQIDKAIERLNTVISIEPDNIKANCLLVQAYDRIGNQEKAAQYAAKCID